MISISISINMININNNNNESDRGSRGRHHVRLVKDRVGVLAGGAVAGGELATRRVGSEHRWTRLVCSCLFCSCLLSVVCCPLSGVLVRCSCLLFLPLVLVSSCGWTCSQGEGGGEGAHGGDLRTSGGRRTPTDRKREGQGTRRKMAEEELKRLRSCVLHLCVCVCVVCAAFHDVCHVCSVCVCLSACLYVCCYDKGGHWRTCRCSDLTAHLS